MRDKAPGRSLDQQLQEQESARDRAQQPSMAPRGSAESHASLSSSIQSVFGNQTLQNSLGGALTDGVSAGESGGFDTLGELIGGAMTLGVAGVPLADDVPGMMANSVVLSWMGGGQDGGEAAGFAGAQGAGAGMEGQAMAAHRDAAVTGGAQGESFDSAASGLVQRALSGGGEALSGEVLDELQQKMGHDFHHVRIHTGGEAVQACEAIHAVAFTVGSDIFFSGGAFDPSSKEGKRLLAHELTHVIQSDEGRLSMGGGGGLQVSDPQDASELEAEENARRVAEDDSETMVVAEGEDTAAHDAAEEESESSAHRASRSEVGSTLRESMQDLYENELGVSNFGEWSSDSKDSFMANPDVRARCNDLKTFIEERLTS
ncbi:MAG: DUF4157 domain-containing protein, partial [Myxococcota bacterium]|nr:DUF4157 domain-containing protein [Myxococcota bacterium]